MNFPDRSPHRSWTKKFDSAFRGIALAVRGQSSFAVHAVFSAAVLAIAVALRVELLEACILILCVAMVWTAETFNSALETLAKAIDQNYNPHLADGLNMASGAVLAAAIGAALVGLVVLGNRLLIFLS